MYFEKYASCRHCCSMYSESLDAATWVSGALICLYIIYQNFPLHFLALTAPAFCCRHESSWMNKLERFSNSGICAFRLKCRQKNKRQPEHRYINSGPPCTRLIDYSLRTYKHPFPQLISYSHHSEFQGHRNKILSVKQFEPQTSFDHVTTTDPTPREKCQVTWKLVRQSFTTFFLSFTPRYILKSPHRSFSN